MPEAELSLMFLRPLNQLGVRYIVSGGIASILYGEPRFPNDLDLVVFLRHEDIQRLSGVFPSPEFYFPPEEAIAAEIDATPAQIALAWLLVQGEDIAPIPGTRRVARVEENTAADQIELSGEQVERLNNLTPAAGERHNEANMASIDQ